MQMSLLVIPHVTQLCEEEFVKMTVYRSKQKKTRKQGKTKRGWFTLEGMKDTLKGSKPLV